MCTNERLLIVELKHSNYNALFHSEAFSTKALFVKFDQILALLLSILGDALISLQLGLRATAANLLSRLSKDGCRLLHQSEVKIFGMCRGWNV